MKAGYVRCRASTGLIPKACNAFALNRKDSFAERSRLPETISSIPTRSTFHEGQINPRANPAWVKGPK